MEIGRYAGNVSSFDAPADFGCGTARGVRRRPALRYTLPARTSPPQLFTRVSRRLGSFPIHLSASSRSGIRDGRGGQPQPLTENGGGRGKTDTIVARAPAPTATANIPTTTTKTGILSPKPSFLGRSFRKLRERVISHTSKPTRFADSLALSSSPSSSSPSSTSSSASLHPGGTSSLRIIPFPSAPPPLRKRSEKASENAPFLRTPPSVRSETAWMTPKLNAKACRTGWDDNGEEDNAGGGGGGGGGRGAAKTLLDGSHPEGVEKSPSPPAATASPAAAPAPWGEGNGDGDDEASFGYLDVEGLGGVAGRSSSKERMDEIDSGGISRKTNKSRSSSSAPAGAAEVADTGDDSSGGRGDSLFPDVDDEWGSWAGTGQRTPPRTSRSPASSPGLTPLRGRSRRGWWRRRRDNYPVDN